MIPRGLDGVVTWAEIDLDALAHNVREIKKLVGDSVEVISSVKANAYGHGLQPSARAALAAGASYLSVHRIHAAVALRKAGITAPILLLGHVVPSGIDLILRNRIIPTIVDRETALGISQNATRSVPVHIKIDTGMSRYGVEPEKAVDFVRYVAGLKHIFIEGLFSHFATSDACDLQFTREQLALFLEIAGSVRAAGIEIPMLHISNSAALIRLPEARLSAVRPGLLVYGMPPSAYAQPPFELRRVLTLKSTVTYVRSLRLGASISYGRTYTAQAPMTTALVSLGYGDGYPRIISNRGSVLIRGQRAPICGRICMDQFVVDVSEIDGVQVGDEVVAIGQQGDGEITAEEVAIWADTINYEITTGLMPQVVRIYKENGRFLLPEQGIEQYARAVHSI